MGIRRGPVDNQSPGLAESAMGSYQSQLNQLAGGSDKNRKYNSDNAVVYEILRRQGDEEAHHKGILETLDILYKDLDDQESAELTAHLNKYGGIGNMLSNLVNLPKDLHTGPGGIHPYAIAQGYQYHSNTKEPKGLVKDMITASTMPLEQRMEVGTRYMTEAVPAMTNRINDMLQFHPSTQTPLDLSAVRSARHREIAAEALGLPMQLPSGNNVRKEGGEELDTLLNNVRKMDRDEPISETMSTKRRFASKPAVEEAARQTYGGSSRSESPGTNRERALIIEAGGDVNIGPGVLRSNGKNGKNGNGHH